MSDDPISHDEFLDALSTIGKVIGFAMSTGITCALSSDGNLDKAIVTFQSTIGAFTDSEALSPAVNLLLGGIVAGVDAFDAAPDNIHDLGDLL